jgi:amidophosphoribosyltransferase
MPAAEELIANNRSESEVADIIGADRLFYLSLPDLIASIHEGNPHLTQFDCSVFNGKYMTDNVDEYLAAAAKDRGEKKKSKKKKKNNGTVIDIV